MIVMEFESEAGSLNFIFKSVLRKRPQRDFEQIADFHLELDKADNK